MKLVIDFKTSSSLANDVICLCWSSIVKDSLSTKHVSGTVVGVVGGVTPKECKRFSLGTFKTRLECNSYTTVLASAKST